MMNNVLVGGTRFDEGGGTIGGEHVVPQVGQVVGDLEAEQAGARDADVVQSRHQLAVVLSHRVAQ